jgi:hypothetical protein
VLILAAAVSERKKILAEPGRCWRYQKTSTNCDPLNLANFFAVLISQLSANAASNARPLRSKSILRTNSQASRFAVFAVHADVFPFTVVRGYPNSPRKWTEVSG